MESWGAKSKEEGAESVAPEQVVFSSFGLFSFFRTAAQDGARGLGRGYTNRLIVRATAIASDRGRATVREQPKE